MAAVFDLDLETEEGSEGEGEPEFSPAVSGPPGRGSIPEPIPSPCRWDRLGSPPPEWAPLLQTPVFLRSRPLLSSYPILPRPAFQDPSPPFP